LSTVSRNFYNRNINPWQCFPLARQVLRGRGGWLDGCGRKLYLNNLMKYRLDEEVALAIVSSISVKAGQTVLTVEHMQKLGESKRQEMIAALKQEFELSPAVTPALEGDAPAEEDYVKKCRRISREPTAT
jgi:hypothetical protein